MGYVLIQIVPLHSLSATLMPNNLTVTMYNIMCNTLQLYTVYTGIVKMRYGLYCCCPTSKTNLQVVKSMWNSLMQRA